MGQVVATGAQPHTDDILRELLEIVLKIELASDSRFGLEKVVDCLLERLTGVLVETCQRLAHRFILGQERHIAREVLHPPLVACCDVSDDRRESLPAAIPDGTLRQIHTSCAIKAQELVVTAVTELPSAMFAGALADVAVYGLRLLWFEFVHAPSL